MRIKTDRAWKLEAVLETDCVDLIEHHIGSNREGFNPHVVIPVEAIDDLVLFLLKAKNKIVKKKRDE